MIESCWDYGPGEVDTGAFKLEPNSIAITGSKGNRSPSASSTGQSGTCIQEQSPVDDSSPCSAWSIPTAPICRQFWKAGAYNEDVIPKSKTQAGSSYLHIHPKFLHSNATSHKWAFGAIAELLDNAVDEIQNGATHVIIDKTSNPRNGSPALLIQDDGAGMDPEAMRRCLSFGFSDKKSNSAIGKYGNGFKTSSMRLGADAIVFSRSINDKMLTQSVGLLSYTFLTQAGYDRIVVPMVHYELNVMTGLFESMQSQSKKQSNSNLSMLLQWSPYSTEEELLKQFDDDVLHGTKIIIYNLWLDDEGNIELDFDSDPEDIRIRWDGKSKARDDSLKAIRENHIAKRLHYSLRAYLSILYLRLPETFCIVLRGQVVLYYNIAMDLKYPEFILYKPNSSGCSEGSVITTIGFLKEAPNVKAHGFNIYHKGRLILPFLPVLAVFNSKGRGVVGVLESNFIEPTHNKQDFEKTSVFQKLVTRLKDMTIEYWDYHCGLIGYQIPKKARAPLATNSSSSFALPPVPLGNSDAIGTSKRAPVITTINNRAALNANSSIIEPVVLVPCIPGGSQEGPKLKRKSPDHPPSFQLKANMNKTGVASAESNMAVNTAYDQKKMILLQENERLQARCWEFEKAEEELNQKVMQLKTELREAQKEYSVLLAELQGLENVEGQNN